MKRLTILLSLLFAVNFASAYEFGATDNGDGTAQLFLKDEGWTGQNFAYLCSNDGCFTATLTDGFWVRNIVASEGDVVSFGAQIDNAGGQILIQNESVTVGTPAPEFSVQLDYIPVDQPFPVCEESTVGVSILKGVGTETDGASIPYLCIKTWEDEVVSYLWVTAVVSQ